MSNHPGFYDQEYRQRRNYIAKCSGPECEDIKYLATETGTWKHIFCKLDKLYKTQACKPYRAALATLDVTSESIPQFKSLNSSLSQYDFCIQPVRGLIDTRAFMTKLAESVMLCTRYIRHHTHPEYTPEPDIVHEVMGHCVFFADKKYRDLNRAFGQAALKADNDTLEKIARVYWYTVEFGICTEDGRPKAWGAGLLSSIKELASISTIDIEVLDLEVLMSTDYDTMNPHVKLYKSTKDFYSTADEIISFLSQI